MAQVDQSSDGLTKAEYRIKSIDGTDISVWRIAARSNISTRSPAVIHAHGGAFIKRALQMESVDLGIFRLKPLGQDWLQRSGVVLLYVSYRIATEKPFPAAADDMYSALEWAASEAAAAMLGIDKRKVGLMGFSAGGNLALSAALRARDGGLPLPVCGLMLIYPMLDPDAEWGVCNDGRGEMESEEVLKDKAFLKDGWSKYLLQGLGDLPEEQTTYARLLSRDCDFTGLPHTYVDVGTADYFLDEDLQLMDRLEAAGVPLTKTTWEGMRHGFEGEKDKGSEHDRVVREAREMRQAFWRRIFGDYDGTLT